MHKFCANCGNPVTISQKFCTECGAANASYEGVKEDPLQARSKILKELEQATLQKVDELRKLREYQQRIHHVPLTEVPETVAKPYTTYSNTYMEQENIRLQKLEMLVQMEEQKLDAFRYKTEKEHPTVPTEQPKTNIAVTVPTPVLDNAPIVEPPTVISGSVVTAAVEPAISESNVLEAAPIIATPVATLPGILEPVAAKPEEEIVSTPTLTTPAIIEEQLQEAKEQEIPLPEPAPIVAEVVTPPAIPEEALVEIPTEETTESVVVASTIENIPVQAPVEEIVDPIIATSKVEDVQIEEITESVIAATTIEDIPVQESVEEIVEQIIAASTIEDVQIEEPVEEVTEPVAIPELIEEDYTAIREVQIIDAIEETPPQEISPPVTSSANDKVLMAATETPIPEVKVVMPTEEKMAKETVATSPFLMEVQLSAKAIIEEAGQPFNKAVTAPKVSQTPPKKRVPVAKIPTTKYSKRTKRILAAAAVLTIMAVGLAAIKYSNRLPPGSNDIAMQAPIPLGHLETGNNTVIAEQNNMSTVIPAGYKDARYVADQWHNLTQLKPAISDEMNHPQYESLSWLISMHKKLAVVDFPELAKNSTKIPDGETVLKPIAAVNDSVQWSLLKYCMEHPTEMADQSTYMALVSGKEVIDINSMYLQIVDPVLKSESSTFYKQAVIRYTRNKERQQVVTNP